MSGRIHDIRVLAAAMAALAAVCAEASEWKNLDSDWYEPEEHVQQTFTLKYADAKGDTTDVVLDFDSSTGEYYVSNSKEVLDSIKQTLRSVAENVLGIAAQVSQNMDYLQQDQERFEMLAQNLDDVMWDVFNRLDEIEIKDGDESKTVIKIEKVENNKTLYRLVGGGVATDEKSVEFAKVASASSTNMTNRLQLRGFDVAKSCQIPCALDGKLVWCNIGDFVDARVFDHGASFVGLNGWDAPGKDVALCEPKLGEMLSGAKPTDAAAHYVLTRYSEGKNSKLHYTKIGNFAGGADNAGKYLRTSSGGESSEWAFPVTAVKSGGGIDVKTDEKTGEVTLTLDGEAISVQSEATTDGTTALMAGRRVVFKAKDDSCVKVDVAQGASTNEIVVTIGCYYK